MSRDWGCGQASGGTFITCAWHRGCSAQYHGSHYTNASGARQEARNAGWLTAQTGGIRVGRGRYARLDYCPLHADAERKRRGMRPRKSWTRR